MTTLYKYITKTDVISLRNYSLTIGSVLAVFVMFSSGLILPRLLRRRLRRWMNEGITVMSSLFLIANLCVINISSVFSYELKPWTEKIHPKINIFLASSWMDG